MRKIAAVTMKLGLMMVMMMMMMGTITLLSSTRTTTTTKANKQTTTNGRRWEQTNKQTKTNRQALVSGRGTPCLPGCLGQEGLFAAFSSALFSALSYPFFPRPSSFFSSHCILLSLCPSSRLLLHLRFLILPSFSHSITLLLHSFIQSWSHFASLVPSCILYSPFTLLHP